MFDVIIEGDVGQAFGDVVGVINDSVVPAIHPVIWRAVELAGNCGATAGEVGWPDTFHSAISAVSSLVF